MIAQAHHSDNISFIHSDNYLQSHIIRKIIDEEIVCLSCHLHCSCPHLQAFLPNRREQKSSNSPQIQNQVRPSQINQRDRRL